MVGERDGGAELVSHRVVLHTSTQHCDSPCRPAHNRTRLHTCASNVGPKLIDAGSQATDAGPQVTDAGPQLVDSGPQVIDAASQATDAGPQIIDAGLSAIDALSGSEDGSTVRCFFLVLDGLRKKRHAMNQREKTPKGTASNRPT
jgi:hypothetical protein